jgi:hypothetical protein
MIDIQAGKSYVIDYTNHEGRRAMRRITVLGFAFGSNQYHPVAEFLVHATDDERKDEGGKPLERTFSAKGIHDAKAA